MNLLSRYTFPKKIRTNVKSNITLALKWLPKCYFISENTYVTIHKDNKTFIWGRKLFLIKIKI